MRIAVLGPLEVRSDTGDPVQVPGAKERLLLALLAAGAPGPVSVDRLADGLWDGDRPPTARKSLQIHLVRLRRALEPQRPRGSPGRLVVRRGAGYSLVATADELDALRIGELVSRGRALLAGGDAAGAEQALTTALGLWRGEPYQDWPDAPFAAGERTRLAELRAAAHAALLEARLELGRHAEVVGDLQALVAEDPLREDWWRLLVLAFYRSGRQGDALAALQRARRVLADELGADPGPQLRALERAVLAQDPGLDAPATAGPPNGAPGPPEPTGAVCPYKGLATYQASDAALFHGRGRMVTRLVARLVDTPLVAVSGSSGAGKSSLVRAGLLPALSRGALPGSEAWTPVVVTPGRSPVDALAVLPGDMPAGVPVVLVCDQLEELWAPGVHPGERAAFLDTVLGMIDDGIVARCVVAVRGDHVGRLAEHAAFAERLGNAVVLVPPLTEAELRAVVREPAAAVGLSVEDELADAVVADVLGRPGALPLLSTALVGTWERRRADRLTLAGYLEAGGVTGALSRSAEAAWAALDDEQRQVARRLLVRLADTDDGGSLVRRPVPLAELDLDGERGAVRRAVVDGFVVRRLLALDGERLDVAHEALLTGWPRLARWLDDDAAGRAVRRHLTPAALEWQRRGRPDDELYRGARLGAALDWAGTADELTAGEREFLDASRAQADAELRAAQQRARSEARGRRRLRWLAGGLAVVLVVALVTAVLAVRAQRAADRATAVAEETSLVADANRLAALSGTAESLDLTYLLAVQGFRLRDTPETRDTLLGSLVAHRRVNRAMVITSGGPLGSLADGGRMVFIGNEITGQLLSWPVDSANEPRLVLEADEDWSGWRATAASPTDPLVLTAGTGESGPWVRTVDADGAVREVLSGADVGGDPIAAVVLPDGRRARLLVAGAGDAPQATWRLVEVDLVDGNRRDTAVQGVAPGPLDDLTAVLSDDGAAAVLVSGSRRAVAFAELDTGRQVPLESPTDDPATYFSFRALPTGAAVLGSDGVVRLYDTEGRIEQQFDAHPGQLNDLDVAPDGTWGVTAGVEGAVTLWNIDAATGRWSEKEVLTGARRIVGTSMIDPSGDRMITLSSDGMLIVWDVSPTGGFGSPRPGFDDRWIAEEPAVVEPGNLVVVPTRPFGSAVRGDAPYLGRGTAEVTATFLDPRTLEIVDEVAVGRTPEAAWSGASVAVSPDRGLVAVGSGLAVTVLDAGSRAVVATLPVPAAGAGGGSGSLPEGLVGPVAWSDDGSRLLVGVQAVDLDLTESRIYPFEAERGGTLVAVDTQTWEIGAEASLDVVPEAIELSPDGRSVALGGGQNATLEIRDTATLQVRSRVQLAAGDRPVDLAWSPDGGLLLRAGEGGALDVVDTATWRARAQALTSDGLTTQIDLLPDGHTVVLAGSNLRLLDLDRGVVRSLLPAGVGQQAATYVVPDPTDELIVLSDQEWIMRYPMAPSAWLRAACGVVGRDLTRVEWERYLPGRPYTPTCTDLG
jgi:DNA-binding SARP family transcriptional activator/WD40 repeat protein